MPGEDENKIKTLSKKIQTLTELTNRMALAVSMGQQYGGDRNVYEALGYPLTIKYEEYAARYMRQDIAKAIIDRPVQVTWRGPVEIVESDDDNETALEKAWKKMEDDLKLKSRFMRLDKLAGIGRYGVLLLGLNDTKNKKDFAKPATGTKKLLYVKPLGEGNAKIAKWEDDTSSSRFGKPVTYDVTVYDSNQGSSIQIVVHHSRVIHITEGMLESEVEGAPRLEVVYNRLMDLEKLIGGDAEMFWRGARPGYTANVAEGFKTSTVLEDALMDQFNEFDHNMRRFLFAEGVDIKALAQQLADPKSHVDVQIQMISASKGIPKRILTGSERGELASTQDREEWLTFVKARREEYAEPNIVRPFIDRCMEYGILPKVEKYTIKWEDLFAPSEAEKVKIGKDRAEALAKYAASPMAEGVIPPPAFLKHFLGLSEDDIKLIEEMRDAYVKEEQEELKRIEEEQAKQVKQGIQQVPQQQRVTTQIQVDPVDWKKVYEDGGAHWLEDLQPSQFAQVFAEKLVAENKQSVLEIGCGNGKDSILFKIAGLNVTGIDIVPEAIEVAKENAERVGIVMDFQEGNAESLTFADASFDAVYSLSVLHSTNMEVSLAEIARVLKFGGIASIFIYSDVQKIDGETTEFISMDEFVDLLKDNEFVVMDLRTDQDEEYDEAGEKHSIIIAEIKKK